MAGDGSRHTTRRQEILRAITHLEQQGYPPTMRELAAEVGLSVAGTYKQLVRLREEGLVTWRSNSNRTLQRTGRFVD